jgi:diguanylate cyclase (GGDEF)-like protein
MLPDEGVHAGRFGWLGALLGALSTVIFWIVVPTGIASVPVTIAALTVCFVAAVAFAVMPWNRLPQPALLTPVLAGVALTVVAVANTGGDQSVFAIFFGYCGLGAGYFATRRQLPWLLAIISAAALSPLLYDGDEPFGKDLFTSLLWVALAVATALLVFYSRARQREAHHQLEALALQDPLTGVANRREFENAVRGEIARSRRSGVRFAVLYLDLDGFKEVNDVHGHAAGDRILRRVATSIDASLRGEDLVARYGGDEFAILLPGASEEAARKASLRVVAAIERISPEDDSDRVLSAGVGIASFPRDGVDLETLMEAGDRALRRVKGGRAVARSVGTPAATALAGLPEPFDPTALLPDEDPGVVGAPAPWRLRQVALAGLGPALLVAALWVGLPLILPATPTRWAILGLAVLCLVVSALTARRVTVARERLGWTIVAAAASVMLIPVAGVWAGIAMAIALFFITGCRPWRDRLALADGLLLFFGGIGVVSVAVMPEIVDRFATRPALLAAALVGVVLVAGGIACALLILPRADIRSRPDAWLLAIGFCIGTIDNVPVQLARHGLSPLPGGIVGVGLPIAAALMAAGAQLRARRPEAAAVTEPPQAISNVLIPLVGSALAISTIFVPVPARIGAALAIVVIAVLRGARFRVIERESRRLRQLAERSQAARAAQSRASLTALSTALLARDGYTGHHGEQTVALARAVAERLGLNAVECAEVESTALLHDIGKIGTPDSILHKPGALTAEEREVMQAHPIIGERIVQAVPGLERVARAVRHEHEAWDGGGYPDGLSGEAIPLSSRIVLVCDAYHAMTSDRPYRAALAPEAAREELERCSGRQFDPAVVRALLGLLTTPTRTAPAARNGQPAEAYAPVPDAEPPLQRTPRAALR